MKRIATSDEAPEGLRRFLDGEGGDRFLEQESRPTGSGRVITLRDVTEQHLRAQQASREERLQAMGLMAAELAHEIRNPLGSLALFAGMLVEDLQQQPPQLELAQRLQESVQRLNLLVTNTLTFSRDLARAVVDTLLSQLRLKAAVGNLSEDDVLEINALLDPAATK